MEGEPRLLIARGVYLAAPLFTQAERLWNLQLAIALGNRGFEMLVPQVLAEQHITAAGKFDPQKMFVFSVETVAKADLVLAVLDGPDADSGTSFECGRCLEGGHPDSRPAN